MILGAFVLFCVILSRYEKICVLCVRKKFSQSDQRGSIVCNNCIDSREIHHDQFVAVDLRAEHAVQQSQRYRFKV